MPDGAQPHRLRLPRQHPAGRAQRDRRGRRLVRGQQRQRRARAARADHAACRRSCAWSSSWSLELGIAFFGHNLVHVFERYAFPVLTVIFVDRVRSGCCSKAHPGAGATTLRAADARRLPDHDRRGLRLRRRAGTRTRRTTPATSRRTPKPRRSACYAGLGVFVSCVLLEIAGAAVVTAGGRRRVDARRRSPTCCRPGSASSPCSRSASARSRRTCSTSTPARCRSWRWASSCRPHAGPRRGRARASALIGFVVAFVRSGRPGELRELPADHRLLDRSVARRSCSSTAGCGAARDIQALARDKRLPELGRPDRDGWSAACCDLAVRQPVPKYIGPIPKHHPAFGDLTFEVGFVIAAVLYVVLFKVLKPKVGHAGADRGGSRSMIQ